MVYISVTKLFFVGISNFLKAFTSALKRCASEEEKENVKVYSNKKNTKEITELQRTHSKPI